MTSFRRRVLVAACSVAIVGLAAVPVSAEPVRTAVPDTAQHLVVSWVEGTTAAVKHSVRDRHQLSFVEEHAAIGVEVLAVPARTATEAAVALRSEPSVVTAEPDVELRAATDDPYWDQLWGLDNRGSSGGVADVDIDAPEAWTTTRGSPDVVVAVIDTGVDIGHPDLAPNIWRNADEVAGNGVDDDGNGYVDDVHGWDFLGDDPEVFDSPIGDRHGTHVAGTIAALADNGIGISGAAPGVQIMPLKFLQADGTGSSADAAAAVAYAHANGATVINASWSGRGASVLRSAVAAATGSVVVAASGNQGRDVDATGGAEYPAGWTETTFGMDHVVSVTSVGRTGELSAFANRGVASVDLGAPGEDIVSTRPGGTYGASSGTSMATPHVSAVAALVASVAPGLRGEALAQQVLAGTRPLGSLAGTTSTGGLVNAEGAIAPFIASPPPAGGGGGGGGAPAPGAGATPNPTEDEPVLDEPLPYSGSGARSLEWACPGIAASGFEDVPDDDVHAPGVGCSLAWKVFEGTSTGLFDPHVPLTRGQLASALARAIVEASGLPLPVGTDHFVDDDASVHHGAIDALAELGIVSGVSESMFRPGSPVSRGQFASMLARTYRHLAGELASAVDHFVDDEGSVHEPAIDALAAIGVAAGTTDGSFHPRAELRRSQAATLVARLLDALVEAGAARRP